MNLCFLGSGCMGKSKTSVVPSRAGSAEAHADSPCCQCPLGAPQPPPQQVRAGRSAGEHTGAASWGPTQGLSLKLSAGSAADSEA